MQIPKTIHRIESLDLLRGLVMVIMALDHSRDFFHHGAFMYDPTDMQTTTPILFFTRWITHFCAPAFVFLAGTSAFLIGAKKSKKELSWFLFTRGLWLIFLELTVINFAWTFDIHLAFHVFQVIWAIGFSMICLSVLIFLPRMALLILGLVIVAGHNLLDPITFSDNSWEAIIWYVLHQQHRVIFGPHCTINFLYPVLPWIGVMILGYCFGELYRTGYDPVKRRKWLWNLGFGITALFFVIRSINIYGDPHPWHVQRDLIFTILSFFNTTKYPPSLLYLCMTLGPAILFLSIAENFRNKLADIITVYGRVPLFYYVVHLYVLHLLATVFVVILGLGASKTVLTGPSVNMADYGYHLWVVYVVWIGVVIALYPLCKWYAGYKARHRDKWWMGYL